MVGGRHRLSRLFLRDALGAGHPAPGAHQVPALILAGCGGVATLIGPIEGLSPVLLCVTTALIGFAVPPREVVVVVLLEWLVLGISGLPRQRGDPANGLRRDDSLRSDHGRSPVREFYARRLVGQTTAQLEQAHNQLAAAQAQLA